MNDVKITFNIFNMVTKMQLKMHINFLIYLVLLIGPSLAFPFRISRGRPAIKSMMTKNKKVLSPPKERLFLNYDIEVPTVNFFNGYQISPQIPVYSVNKDNLVFYISLPFLQDYYLQVDLCKMFVFQLLVRCYDTGEIQNSDNSNNNFENEISTNGLLTNILRPTVVKPTITGSGSGGATTTTTQSSVNPSPSPRLEFIEKPTTFQRAITHCESMGAQLWVPVGSVDSMMQLVADTGTELPALGIWLGAMFTNGQTMTLNGDVINDSEIDATPQEGDAVMLYMVDLIGTPNFIFEDSSQNHPYYCQFGGSSISSNVSSSSGDGDNSNSNSSSSSSSSAGSSPSVPGSSPDEPDVQPEAKPKLLFINQQKTFQVAVDTCALMGSKLWAPSVGTEAMMQQIEDSGAQLPDLGVWLGAMFHNGQTVTINGDVIDGSLIDRTPQEGDGVMLYRIELIGEPSFIFEDPNTFHTFFCQYTPSSS